MNDKNFNETFLQIVSDALQGKNSDIEIRVKQLLTKINSDSHPLFEGLNSILSKFGKSEIYRSTKKTIKSFKPLDADSRQELLTEEYPVSVEVEPILSKSNFEEFRRFYNERRQSELLIINGLTPSKSLLLTGPPGTGKTLSAKWLAKKLNLPLLTLDLATVMSSFLGKTGNNIRSVIDYAKQFPCVLLLDEFDSIAKKRDDESDVGELKRLVTVLLQSIDDWPYQSVLIAASNHGELLDPAIWRRFDKLIEFELPSDDLIKNYFLDNGLSDKVADLLTPGSAGLSFATIERKLKQAKVNSLLENINYTISLANEFGIGNSKEAIIVEFNNHGYSQRKIASELGVSRNFVSKIVQRQA